MSSFQIWRLLHGLKIVGTGACLPCCSISSSLQNSLKMCGHQGYEFLEFWCWNLVPFLPDIGFQLLKSLWSSLTYFSFNDAKKKVLYRWKIWTAGQFSTRSLLLRSHAVVIAAVCGFALSCWNTQGLPWNRCRLEGSICCSKTFIYLSPFIVPSKTCKLPIPYALMHPYHQRCWLLNWTLITRWKVSLLFSPEDTASLRWTRIVFTDSGFWKYSWAHLVMSMTESCRWVMHCTLPIFTSERLCLSKTSFYS